MLYPCMEFAGFWSLVYDHLQNLYFLCPRGGWLIDVQINLFSCKADQWHMVDHLFTALAQRLVWITYCCVCDIEVITSGFSHNLYFVAADKLSCYTHQNGYWGLLCLGINYFQLNIRSFSQQHCFTTVGQRVFLGRWVYLIFNWGLVVCCITDFLAIQHLVSCPGSES